MATKVWKGFLNFGLLSIPVYLNTAARDKKIALNQFHVACKGQIKMPKYCPACDVQLQPTDIFRGYNNGSGSVVPLTDEELDAISPETVRTMEISEMVPANQVDPVYFAESFYLLPDDAGKKAYALLVATLKSTGKVAIAQLTKSAREHVVLIRPKGNGLFLNYIWYESEINRVPEFDDLKAVALSPAELKLAGQLAESLSAEFDPSQYVDAYAGRLTTLIASKTDTSIPAPTPVKAVAQTQTVDILKSLEMSLVNQPKRKVKPQPDSLPAPAAKATKKSKKAA